MSLLNERLGIGADYWTRITPNVTAGVLNDIVTTDLSCLRFTLATALTGFAGGYDGKIVSFIVSNPAGMLLSNENVGSIAANRISIVGGSDSSLSQNSLVSMRYDGTDSRWKITGGSGGSGGGATIEKLITQVGHNLAVSDLVSLISIGTYVKSNTSQSQRELVVGIVKTVVDANTFIMVQSGYVTGLSGLIPGRKYFASNTSGALAVSPPAHNPNVALQGFDVPVLLPDTATSGWFFPNTTSKTNLAFSNNYFAQYYDSSRLVTTSDATVSDTGNRALITMGDWASTNTSVLTLNRSTTQPIRGNFSYEFASSLPGANALGLVFVESLGFTMPSQDVDKNITISFEVVGLSAGTYDVCVVKYNSSGVYQNKISVTGTQSSASFPSALIPLGATNFLGTFLATGTANSDVFAVRIRQLTGTELIKFDGFSVENKPQSAFFGSTDPQTYVPVITGGQTLVQTYVKWAQDGAYIVIDGRLDITGAGGGADVSVRLPPGLLLDVGASSLQVGAGSWQTATVVHSLSCQASNAFQNRFTFTVNSNENNTLQGNDLSASDIIFFNVKWPVVGWSANITSANRSLDQYATNTGAAVAADDTTSFLQGANFQPVIAYTVGTSGYYKRRIRSVATINATDKIIPTLWTGNIPRNFEDTYPAQLIGLNNYGFYWEPVVGVPTDIDCYFGKAGANPSTAWAAALGNWAVNIVTGGALAGFPINTSNLTDTRVLSATQTRDFKQTSIAGFANVHSATLGKPSYNCKVLVTVTHTFQYANSNGTPMGTGHYILILDGASTVFSSGPNVISVPTGFGGTLTRTVSVILDYPAAASFTFQCFEENSGGGSYTATNSLITATTCSVRI